ncbi:response regulator [Bacillus pinisoli]|uniref:response regulator n=1 Tax=Bacillus pinisoli TaxID=2901866 RepID=UPI001FF580BA|nr:response regulator [Bacillus pinisoli]
MDSVIEVLIVEDDKRIAEIHRRFTEKIDGFTVVGTATTGEQAKDWLETVQPQLVLLDVYLPDMKGIELVKFIRQHFTSMDIIMITAASEVDIIRQALHGGVVDYIVKPLTFDRFKICLENYRLKVKQLSQHSTFTQEQIEELWNNSPKQQVEEDAPKGIDPLTLEKLLESISSTGIEGITAEELSKKSGVSRSTARRYLEYLILQKKINAQLIYGHVGRPERKYFLL